MANIAHNTYLFYGDKDELVKCHAMLNDIYEKVGSDESCVNVTSIIQNAEWISFIGHINPGLDDRFYMVTESRNYGNPVYWYNWVNSNFTNLSVAFRCEEPLLEIFEQVDPDNELSDVVWVQGRYIPQEDVQKLHPTLRDCCHREASGPANSFYVIGSFYRDVVFNNSEHLPDTIEVREYINTTYDALTAEQKRLKSREDEWRTAYENDTLSELWSKYEE
jgi:hypothetical protein